MMTTTTKSLLGNTSFFGLNNRLFSRHSRRVLNTAAAAAAAVPFYGTPRPPTRRILYDPKNSTTAAATGAVSNTSTVWERLSWTCHYARVAVRDPTRADAVAAVGELTGYHVLHNSLVPYLQQQVTGRELLRDRPIVSQATIPYKRLLQQAREWQQQEQQQQQQAMTFGQAYGLFLLQHGFDPDERDAVQYLPVLEDSDEAYVMLRYRQCHDFFHALTGLPPTVPGELALKWLELFQTQLPMTALACTAGLFSPTLLSRSDRALVWNTYLPWARQCHRSMQQKQQQQQQEEENGTASASAAAGAVGGCALLNVYYEREWDTPLDELRNRLGLIPAPVVEQGHEPPARDTSRNCLPIVGVLDTL